ncbi:MAG TPA: hypothetical protein VF541_13600 [Longimicrobium sp.]
MFVIRDAVPGRRLSISLQLLVQHMNARIAFALAAAFSGALLVSRPAAAQTDTTAAHADSATAAATPAQPAAPAHRVRRDRNVLTAEDLAGRHEENAYAIVRTMRPAWLRGGRGTTSNAQQAAVVIYRDGVKLGGEGELRQISTVQIREIRFLDAMQATQHFGLDHAGGAILVTTQ